MRTENITVRDDIVIRRMILEPGEKSDWHTDACQRFSVIIRGSRLGIEYRDSDDITEVDIHPGLADWDSPTDRIHRAINTGVDVYEEVVTFYRDDASVDPQPVAQ